MFEIKYANTFLGILEKNSYNLNKIKDKIEFLCIRVKQEAECTSTSQTFMLITGKVLLLSNLCPYLNLICLFYETEMSKVVFIMICCCSVLKKGCSTPSVHNKSVFIYYVKNYLYQPTSNVRQWYEWFVLGQSNIC